MDRCFRRKPRFIGFTANIPVALPSTSTDCGLTPKAAAVFFNFFNFFAPLLVYISLYIAKFVFPPAGLIIWLPQKFDTMKENYTQLYPNEQVATAVGDYAFEHSTKLPKHITDQHAWASENHDRANYMISPFQAQFLVWTAKAVGAKRSKQSDNFNTSYLWDLSQTHLLQMSSISSISKPPACFSNTH